MKLVQRALIASIFSALLVFAAGCGGDKKSRVTGIITYKNEPVKGGNIYLTNDAGGSFSSPITMEGAYTITDIVPGTYSVTVDTESVNPDRKSTAAVSGRGAPSAPNNPAVNAPGGKADTLNKEYAERMGKSAPAGNDAGSGGGFGAPSKEDLLKRYTKIPGKYGSKATSGLTFEVGNGTTTKDFPLAD